MKKLKLNLDDLKVESFETTPEQPKPKGTVVGNAEPTELQPCDYSENPTDCLCVTYAATCPNTCYNTCASTCSTCGSTCEQTCGEHCHSTWPAPGCTD